MLKKLLGIAPKLETDGSYSPSKLALKLATSDTTNYEKVDYTPYQGQKSKILVLCTEQKNMTMQNGKRFSTGNHPVETFLPMLHLKEAGYDFEIATPSGKPAVIEMWAFPEKDQHVKTLYNEYKAQLDRPISLEAFVDGPMASADDYAAIFIPGGHGAMLGIPEDKNVRTVLNWAHDNDLYTLTLCHGPGVLLATQLDGQAFLYADYKMAVFPDSVDDMTPKVGYLPGKMTTGLSRKLEELGVTLMNSKADNTVCIDRKLITGASPEASNALGQLAAETLLKS